MRKNMLIAGNWKMNTDISQAVKLAGSVAKGLLVKDKSDVEVLLCPPFTNLTPVYEAIADKPLALGAQNCHFEESGAYTGEISVSMLKAVNCEYVILGHSERRAYFGESDELIGKKLNAAIKGGLKVIMCIGETLEERKAEKTFEILERQLSIGLENFEVKNTGQLVIAYEPVWAIGTGVAAKPEQVQEAHARIRKFLLNKFGTDAENILILYGGSIKPENAEEILTLEDVNGGLIGGASLKAEPFLSIIASAEKVL